MSVFWPPTPVGGGAGRREHGRWEAMVLVIEYQAAFFSLDRMGSMG